MGKEQHLCCCYTISKPFSWVLSKCDWKIKQFGERSNLAHQHRECFKTAVTHFTTFFFSVPSWVRQDVTTVEEASSRRTLRSHQVTRPRLLRQQGRDGQRLAALVVCRSGLSHWFWWNLVRRSVLRPKDGSSNWLELHRKKEVRYFTHSVILYTQTWHFIWLRHFLYGSMCVHIYLSKYD